MNYNDLIIQSYNKSQDIYQNYLNKLNEFFKCGFEIEKIYEGPYVVQENIDDNEIETRGFIFSSELVNKLYEKGITNFTLGQLKKYAIDYSKVYNGLAVMKLLEQYDNIKILEQLLNNYYKWIELFLLKLFNKDYITDYSKDKYYEALDSLDNMHNNLLVDDNNYNNAKYLLDNIFEYYLNQPFVLPVNEYREKLMQGSINN